MDSVAPPGVSVPRSLSVLCFSVEIVGPLSPLVLLTVFPTSVPLVEHTIEPFALAPSPASTGEHDLEVFELPLLSSPLFPEPPKVALAFAPPLLPPLPLPPPVLTLALEPPPPVPETTEDGAFPALPAVVPPPPSLPPPLLPPLLRSTLLPEPPPPVPPI